MGRMGMGWGKGAREEGSEGLRREEDREFQAIVLILTGKKYHLDLLVSLSIASIRLHVGNGPQVSSTTLPPLMWPVVYRIKHHLILLGAQRGPTGTGKQAADANALPVFFNNFLL